MRTLGGSWGDIDFKVARDVEANRIQCLVAFKEVFKAVKGEISGENWRRGDFSSCL